MGCLKLDISKIKSSPLKVVYRKSESEKKGVQRFTSVDPISDQFAYLSTYNYASNSPIVNIDLWGLQGIRADLVFDGISGDPGLRSINATKQERVKFTQDAAKGFAIGVGVTAAGYGLAAASPTIGTAIAGAVETSGTTMAINASVDATVQTVSNLAQGENPVTNFDITGTIGSTLTNPIIGSAIDATLDVSVNEVAATINGTGSLVNSPQEAVVGTVVGGGLGKVVGGLADDIAKSGHKLISNVFNAVAGLFRDTNETVGKKLADEQSREN